MMNRATALLFATTAVPLLAVLGIVVAQCLGRRRWATRLVAIEMIGGMTGGIVLAVFFWFRSDDPSSIAVILGNWFRISTPQSVAVSIGLEATLAKSCLVAAAGFFAFIFLWKGGATKPPSDDCILSTATLYLAVIAFIYSPSLPQSLLGWAAISLFTTILFRLCKSESSGSTDPWNAATIQRSPPAPLNRDGGSRAMQVLAAVIKALEWIAVTAGESLMKAFPSWVMQEAKLIEYASDSIPILAAALGTTAILLTWLLLLCHSGGTF